MAQRSREPETRPHERRPHAPVVSDADRLQRGLPLESGDALPPPRPTVH